MVISSTLTTQLENVRAPVPLSRTRPRSVPAYTSRVLTNTPASPRPKKKRVFHRTKFIEDKPPFVNFASAYIDPYRPLSAVSVSHRSRCQSRSKSSCSKRSQMTPDNLTESMRGTEPRDRGHITKLLTMKHTPIDVSPKDATMFDKTFCRKRQMIIDNSFYRTKVDTWKAASLNHLLMLIADAASEKNVIDRVWMIYYWLSQNIRYDIDADFNSHNRHQAAEDVFRTGKSTCEGFASIFKSLCDGLEIPCEKITGYAKDYSFKIDHPTFEQTNHTWNAVQLNNEHWYLIDSAWGTGYIDGNHEYKKDLKSHYFLTHPEHMIYNHLPQESRWQLLAQPITMEDYIRLPHVHSYYFIFGLNIISPRFSSIVSFQPSQCLAEVLLEAPDNIQLTCSIKDDIRSTSLTQYDYNRQVWQCLFAPHKTGFHTLVIYANEISTTSLLKNAIELGVDVPSNELIPGKKLPMTFGKFTEHKCQIFSPFDGVLKRGSKATIRCRIPNATSARISLDGIWLDEKTLKNEMFKQQIHVPDREVIVYAQFSKRKGTQTYDGLIRYAVEK